MINFDFLEKSPGMSLIWYSMNLSNLMVWLPLLLEILGNTCIAIVRFPGCKDINFEIKVSNQPAFLLDLKQDKKKTKILITWERKELLSWNNKHFPWFLNGFQFPKIVADLRVRLLV